MIKEVFFICLPLLSGCDHRNNDAPQNGTISISKSSQPTSEGIALRSESLPYITVQEIFPESYASSISAPARVEFRSKAVSSVGTIVPGRIAKIFAQVGDRIKAGSPLATITSSEAAKMRSDLAQAQEELARAQDQYRRQLEMQKTGVGLEIEKVAAETQLKLANNELKRSQESLETLGTGHASEVVVKAPIDSVVLKSHISMGAAVGSGSPLFDLGEPSAAWIIADVFEKDLPLVEKGAKVNIELASLPDPIQGHVVAESAAIQTDLRRASVFIEVDDQNVRLRPGMYARVTIEATSPARIILPTAAILIKDGHETIVYIEKKTGMFSPQPVQVGQDHNGMTPILKGLSGGERVVVKGALLIDGEASILL